MYAHPLAQVAAAGSGTMSAADKKNKSATCPIWAKINSFAIILGFLFTREQIFQALSIPID